MEMTQGYWVSQIRGTTTRLALGDQLHDGPTHLLPAGEPHLYRPRRARPTAASRRHSRALHRTRGRAPRATPLGAQLTNREAAGSLGDLAIALSAPGRWLPYGRLFDAVVTGQTQARQARGTDPRAHYASHPEERWHFARAMGISAEASAAVARHDDVAPFRRIVDVGGSQDVLLAGLLPAAPSATAVRFDLPKVVNGAREVLAASGPADRVELVGGDFFEQVPAGCDPYLLKSILHDWHDECALQILRNIHRAPAPGARLAVIEAPLP